MQLTERYANRLNLYQRMFTSTYEISHAVKSPSFTRSLFSRDRFKRKLLLMRCPSLIIVPDLSNQLRHIVDRQKDHLAAIGREIGKPVRVIKGKIDTAD